MIAPVLFRLEVCDEEMGQIGGCLLGRVPYPRDVRCDGGAHRRQARTVGRLDEEPSAEAGDRGGRRRASHALSRA